MSKRYIKNIFSIAGVEWMDGTLPSTLEDGIIITQSRIRTDTDRRIIADRQYIVSLNNLSENVLIPIILPLLNPIYNSEKDGERTDKDVGNIPAGTPFSELDSKPINEILDDIFFTDAPFILSEDQQFMTKSLPADLVEIGSSIQFDVIAANFRGVIRSASLAPDIELIGDATQYTFTDYTGTITPYPGTANSQNHIGDIFPAIAGDMAITCLIEWQQGSGSYFNEDGDQSNAFDPQRVAGSDLVTQQVTGVYNMYFGEGALGSFPTTPAAIRALSSQFLGDVGETIELEIILTQGVQQLYFYVPESATVDAIFNFSKQNMFVGSDFVTQVVPMEDGGGNVVNYTEFRLDVGGIGFLEEQTYKITVTS